MTNIETEVFVPNSVNIESDEFLNVPHVVPNTEENLLLDGNQAENIKLFSIQLTVFVRLFKGQTSGKSIGAWELNVSTIEEFRSVLWQEVKPFLKREIVMEANDVKWHDHEEPIEAELNKFVLFYDKISKRTTELDNVNTTVLHLWLNRSVYLYIHEYSMSVSSKSMFQTVQKQLIQPLEKDRAGAASQVIVLEIVKELKERHKNNFKATDICWYQWANKILSSESHRQDDLINSPPPVEIIHLFKSADEADNHLRRVQRGVVIAQNVNDGISMDWGVIKETIHSMEPHINGLVDLFQNLKTRAAMVERHLLNNESLLSAFDEATSLEQNPISESLERQIDDQLDVDHD